MAAPTDFHHIEFSVTNALQSSYWYCCCFGFQRFAEKKTKDRTSIAIRNNTVSIDAQSPLITAIRDNHQKRRDQVVFVFTSSNVYSEEEKRQLLTHGDTVKDVALRVDDLHTILKSLESQNIPLYEPLTEINDDFGSVRYAKVRSQDTDIIHSLIELSNYSGVFLPHFKPIDDYSIFKSLKKIPLELLDHVVQTYDVDCIEDAADWYRNTMQLQRFWSVDDLVAKSEFSAIKAWLVTNSDRRVQLTLAETEKGRVGRSQIQEFVEYNGGPGIQHIALRVDDIVETVTRMKQRSVEFLTVPSTYYDVLEERLRASNLEFREDMKKLRELCILMDFDDNGYLLQIFTKPMQDRPTLFIEIIQRRNFNGFGAGNFKALFEAVEREQKLRGTLY